LADEAPTYHHPQGLVFCQPTSALGDPLPDAIVRIRGPSTDRGCPDVSGLLSINASAFLALGSPVASFYLTQGAIDPTAIALSMRLLVQKAP
jgi:hypothetical protein